MRDATSTQVRLVLAISVELRVGPAPDFESCSVWQHDRAANRIAESSGRSAIPEQRVREKPASIYERDLRPVTCSRNRGGRERVSPVRVVADHAGRCEYIIRSPKHTVGPGVSRARAADGRP